MDFTVVCPLSRPLQFRTERLSLGLRFCTPFFSPYLTLHALGFAVGLVGSDLPKDRAAEL